MADTNSAIHQYRMRSNLQPDIKHIPKTLFGALKESDIPMTDDELAKVSLRLSDRNLSKKGGNNPPKPAHHLKAPNTVKPAPSEKGLAASSALANAFTNSNPLDEDVQKQQEHTPSVNKKTSETSSYTWLIATIVVLLLLAVVGAGIYYYK